MPTLKQFKQTMLTSRNKNAKKIEKGDQGYSSQHKKIKPSRSKNVYRSFPKEKPEDYVKQNWN